MDAELARALYDVIAALLRIVTFFFGLAYAVRFVIASSDGYDEKALGLGIKALLFLLVSQI